MNLFDMLTQAQGGNGLQSLGQKFGLSPQQTQAAVEALLPAFSKGFQQNASSTQGFGSLLTALASGKHGKFFEDATNAFSAQGVAEGNGILGHLFGSKELSRAVAAQASQATGISQDTLKQMLPSLATMLMGGLFKQSNNQLQGGAVGASNPLGEIIEQMMRQGGQAQQAPQPGAGNNPLGDILGQILGGGAPGGQSAPQSPGNNPLGDILGQILGGGGQQGQSRQPQGLPGGSGDNPIGDILGQILRGGAPQDAQDEEPQAPPQRRAPRQQQQPSNPLEDILGKMFNPGGQQTSQSEQYQQGIDNIFEQFRRGVERYQR
jgi:hypothetical protein